MAEREHDHDSRGLANLQRVLESAATEAGRTQSILQQATSKFTAVADEVVSVVGGSAQAVDKELTQALQETVHQTNSAIAALGAASSSSRAAM